MNKWYMGFIMVLMLPAPAMSQDQLAATEILGRPTDHSVTVNAVADFSADAYVEYGTVTGNYPFRTDTTTFASGTPVEIVIGGLQADTRYYYRVCYRRTGTTPFIVRDEHTFHTQRPHGSTFRFTIQSDSHLYDKKGSHTLMPVAMQNQLNDSADFVFDLGDTFGDDHNPYTITDSAVWQLHRDFRPYIGLLSHSSPFFFCIGNHEGETGYYLNQTPPNNLATYATLSRQFYYPNPFPDVFYSGDTVSEAYGMGLPENYYAWEWGDALFVVLDVYRYATATEKPGGWDWTIGTDQYNWFRHTLETSTAKYKFVFAHHVLGQTRGAVAWARLYEWGGYNADGTTWGFSSNRPGWAMPLHQLMVANGVTIFFQGHDHLFAKEQLDGVIYQEIPMPSDSTDTVGMVNAPYYTGDTLENSGHVRVTVSAGGVQVDYVKAVLPEAETPEHPNGEIAHSYSVGAPPARYTISVAQVPNGIISPGTTLVDSGGSQRFELHPSPGYHADSLIVDGAGVPDSLAGYTFINVVSGHTLTAHFAPDTAATTDSLLAAELLGRPTDHSVTLSIVPGNPTYAYVDYGTTAGVYSGRTDTSFQAGGRPMEILIDNLLSNTQYYYRLMIRPEDAAEYTARTEYSFHTQRPRGTPFVFDVQADPHLGIPTDANRDTNVDTLLYGITLRNELADRPDFLFDLGDSFMNEKYYSTGFEITRQAYFAHRRFYEFAGHSVPLFLVNGNHEGELGWRMNGTASNLALWSVRARNLYYPNPVPGGFFSGSSTPDLNLLLDTAIVNKLRDGYYAFEWGNALFVALDPFWYTTAKPTSYPAAPSEGWKFTLGADQFAWLRQVLQTSTAPFKFLFIHNLVGGNSKDGRGGSEAAGFYEWGGKNINGIPEWDAMRGWADGPIHDLCVANGVSAVLHGHDHFFCRQELDSVVYQECPQPGVTNYTETPASAATYGYMTGTLRGNSGHLRFTVGDTAVQVDYVRAYRPQDETPARHNGDITYSYNIKAAPRLVMLAQAAGWNMISIPSSPAARPKDVLFPGAVSKAFSYAGKYTVADTLMAGRGYWLKFSAPETIAVQGIPITLDTVDVVPGWNMIGATAEHLPVSMISSETPGFVTSRFFGYSSGTYHICDTLLPGRGYWVKTNNAGTLILSSYPGGGSGRRIVTGLNTGAPPPSPEKSVVSWQDLPAEFDLGMAYPNPFNPVATVRYALPVECRVTVRIYNALGQEVALLHDGLQAAGRKTMSWNGGNFPSGVYILKLWAGSAADPGRVYSQSRKLILVK